MDYHAFDKLSYGLYIVSSEAGGKAAGCIVHQGLCHNELLSGSARGFDFFLFRL